MKCRICNNLLNQNNWLLSRQKRKSYICKFCENKQNLKRYSLNKKKYSKKCSQKYSLTKSEVFDYYGGECELCKTTNKEILSLDHIDGCGRKHRKSILKYDSGTAFYKWVHINKPNNLRLLCYNCNCAIKMEKYNLVINYNKIGICKYCGVAVDKFRICNSCLKQRRRNLYIDLKNKVFSNYGNCCKHCGESNVSFLTIDHIGNNGNEHRKDIGTHIYSWLKCNNYPQNNYQILCFNCNYLKFFTYLNT